MKRLLAFSMICLSAFSQGISTRNLNTNDFSIGTFVSPWDVTVRTQKFATITTVNNLIAANAPYNNWATNPALGGFSNKVGPTALTGDLILKDGRGVGNGIGLTNIPLSGLSQSSASSGQIAQWNGTAWVPVSFSALSGYQTNFATTNTSAGLTNIIQQIATNTSSLSATTNIFNALAPTLREPTNSWAGPSANIDLALCTNGSADLDYTATANCTVTGFINKPTTNSAFVILTVTNSTASDITLTIPGSVTTDDGLRVYTITNKLSRSLWFHYNPKNYTNGSSRLWY